MKKESDKGNEMEGGLKRTNWKGRAREGKVK